MSQLVYLQDGTRTLQMVVTEDYPVLLCTDQTILSLVRAIDALDASSTFDALTFSSTLTVLLADTRQVVYAFTDKDPFNPSYTAAFTNGTWTEPRLVLLGTVLSMFLRLNAANRLTSLSYTTP